MSSFFFANAGSPNSFAFRAYVSKVLGSVMKPWLCGCFSPSGDFAGSVNAGNVAAVSIFF